MPHAQLPMQFKLGTEVGFVIMIPDTSVIYMAGSLNRPKSHGGPRETDALVCTIVAQNEVHQGRVSFNNATLLAKLICGFD